MGILHLAKYSPLHEINLQCILRDMKIVTGKTTTIRVHKTTQERLKRIAANTGVTVTDLVDQIIERHEKSFWDGFDDEARAALTPAEKKTRLTFEGALGDGLD